MLYLFQNILLKSIFQDLEKNPHDLLKPVVNIPANFAVGS